MLFQGANDLQNQIDSPEAAAVRKIGTDDPRRNYPACGQGGRLLRSLDAWHPRCRYCSPRQSRRASRGFSLRRLADGISVCAVGRLGRKVCRRFCPDRQKYCRLHHVRVVNMSWLITSQNSKPGWQKRVRKGSGCAQVAGHSNIQGVAQWDRSGDSRRARDTVCRGGRQLQAAMRASTNLCLPLCGYQI